jgi:hypothetical protein
VPDPNVIEGTVTNTEGRPLAGARIQIVDGAGVSRANATTDLAGRYRVTVPPGEYAVDGVVDLEYGGATFKELWLDRGNAACGRVSSDRGIVRDFVLRLSGRKRCAADADPTSPNAYNGAQISARSADIPADALITFVLTPLGPLADGTNGGTLTFSRTGAALRTTTGPIDQTSMLYDIPLGRYRATADARYADGVRHGISLQLPDGGSASQSIDIAFAPNVSGGGIRPVSIALVTDSAVIASTPSTPSVVPTSRPTPSAVEKTGVDSASRIAELPIGRYACSTNTPFAGDMPSQRAIYILAGGHYQGFGGSGAYLYDPAKQSVRWTSGPLAGGDLRVTYGERYGLPTITVVGGGPVDDPMQRNYCVLMGR